MFCAIVIAWLHVEVTWHELFLGNWAEASKVCTTLHGHHKNLLPICIAVMLLKLTAALTYAELLSVMVTD